MKLIDKSFLTFWVGVILWLGVDGNQECSSVYPSECDILTGAGILGIIFAVNTVVVVTSGADR